MIQSARNIPISSNLKQSVQGLSLSSRAPVSNNFVGVVKPLLLSEQADAKNEQKGPLTVSDSTVKIDMDTDRTDANQISSKRDEGKFLHKRQNTEKNTFGSS